MIKRLNGKDVEMTPEEVQALHDQEAINAQAEIDYELSLESKPE